MVWPSVVVDVFSSAVVANLYIEFTCARFIFLIFECGPHVSIRTRRISQTCLGFCFFIILAETFVHQFRLYTSFCCMESLVLGRCTLLASHFQEGLLRL